MFFNMSGSSNCIDVIVPVFNGRDTIVEALQSALAQDGRVLNKIFVIDDGSTDGTPDVVSALDNEKIHLILTLNSGVAAARNRGIKESSAQWVAFMDADDVWVKEKLVIQLNAAAATSSGFVCGAVNGVPVMPSKQISLLSLWNGNFVATSTVLVKREVLLQVLPVFNKDMAFAEDYLAWIKCLMLTNGYYVSENLATYNLSEVPRYTWRVILKNIIRLNIESTSFLWSGHFSLFLKIIFPFIQLAGSCSSLFSIAKRFFNARQNPG